MGRTKKTPNPRRGRVKKAAADAPAEIAQGTAAGPLDFDAADVAESLGLHWKSGSGDSFVRRGGDGRWSVWPMQATVDAMRNLPDRMIAIKVREGEMLSEVKQVFLWVRENRCLDEVFQALPGYRSGIHELDTGEQVLVKSSPRIIEASAGEWPNIRQLIDGRLDLTPDGDIDQTPYFHSWCKIALEALMRGEPGQWRQGHAMILTGPGGCGKNRLQEQIITPLLGGRMANPTKFLFDGDEFNGDVFAAEHLMMGEVPSPSQKSVDRTALAERIKQVVANSHQRMRLMRTEPWTVFPYWRLTISLNDDPDKLRSLPLITADFGDKVLIFHCRAGALPILNGDSIENQKEFRDTIAAELPAYAHWLLNEWQIPAALLSYDDGRPATRFGFREWHHPVIKGELFDDTPAAQLMNLLDMAEFFSTDWSGGCKLWHLPHGAQNASHHHGIWHERAETLQQLLTGEAGCSSNVATMAKKLFAHNQCSRLLSRLAADEVLGSTRVAKQNTRDWKGWAIAAPPKPRS